MENQQRKYRLVSRLYRGVFFAFWGMLALMSYTIYTDIEKHFSGEKKDAYYNRNSAYTLPVKMRLTNIADTIISYTKTNYFEGKKTGGSKGSIIIDGGISSHSKKEIDSIVNDTAFKKKIVTHYTGTFFPSGRKMFEIDKVMDSAKGEIYVKPKNIAFTVLLFLNYYAQPLTILIVLWLLTRLLRNLNDNFSFSSGLAKGVKLIGYAILIYQVLAFIIDWLVSYYFAQAHYMEKHAGEAAETILTLYPEGNAGLSGAITGLFLVVLSKLLQYGYELQEENELTI